MYNRFFAGCVLCFFLTGCGISTSSFENRYFPVKSLKERKSSLGFTITPPSGMGWYEKLHKDSLYYLKRVQNNGHEIYTKAQELRLQQKPTDLLEFVEFVVESKAIDAASGIYKNYSFRYFLDYTLSPYCVRYSQSYDDYNHSNLKTGEFVKVTHGGLVCLHPDTPKTGVDMSYKESYLDTRQRSAKSYRREGEHFLSSLRFL